ncbi:MAG: universal stress protein [Verrucomicrobia bacterium]|nr:universal stress protein [Verrucomicrobiota bacterium]
MIGETTAGGSRQPRQEGFYPVEQVRHIVTLKRILAPTELTMDSRKAVDYAIAIAEHFNAQVTLLHVYAAPDPEVILENSITTGLRTMLGMPWIRSGPGSDNDTPE